MLDFPKSTVFSRRISKEKFYAKMDIDNALRQKFVVGIESIIWLNKLSASTLNVAEGKTVVEIEVLEIFLKQREIDGKLLEFLDRNLPHHIVFILRYHDSAQLVIHYKEPTENHDSKFKIEAAYRTAWIPYDSLSLSISGLNLDKVYENFILQVAGEKLAQGEMLSVESGMKNLILRAQEQEKLQAQIDALETKIRKEKQFNIQLKLNDELRALKKEL